MIWAIVTVFAALAFAGGLVGGLFVITRMLMQVTQQLMDGAVRSVGDTITASVQGVVEAIGEQLRPVVAEDQVAPRNDPDMEPPWAAWGELDPDPTDAEIPDPTSAAYDPTIRTIGVPPGYPMPGDRSAENLQ